MQTSENRPSGRTSVAILDGAANKNMVRLDWIDVLRGMAILMVILIHVGTQTHGLNQSIRNFTDYGARGVQLFFIVSAFTLFRTVSRKFNPKSFYVRRYARIAPMFFIALIFYAIVRYVGWGNQGWNAGGLASYLLIIPFLHGLSPYSYNSLVPGGWSVSSEFLFYYSLPFLAFFCRGFKSTVLVLCLAFVEAAIWTRIYPSHIEPFLVTHIAPLDPNGSVVDFINFAFLYQLPVFVSGMLLVYIDAEAIRHFCASSKLWGSALRVSPYLAVAILLVAAASGNVIMQNRTATIFILFSLVLCFSLSPRNILVNRVMILIGKYSYSIYLVHFVFLDIYPRLTMQLLPHQSPILHLIIGYGLVGMSSYVIAALTYRLIEDPFIKLGHKLSNAIAEESVPQRRPTQPTVQASVRNNAAQ
jgi:peptidoglycan/LPS O-acetylase OafA/YrhL